MIDRVYVQYQLYESLFQYEIKELLMKKNTRG